MIRKIMNAALLVILPTIAHAALAASVDVQSIAISPAETVVGKRPAISVTIKANADAGEIMVIASLVRPDNEMRSWNWKNVVIKSGETRKIFLPADYDIGLAGVYRIDFSVYTKDMRPLSRISKTFVVAAAGQTVQPAAPATAETRVQTSREAQPEKGTEGHQLGIGIFGTAMNAAGGGTLLLCPSKYVCLQGNFSAGKFTSEEGRLLLRFPLESGITPYVGGGYAAVATERTVDLLYVKTTLRDSGPTGVLGVEVPFSKSVAGYVEVTGASIDLKKDVSNGSLSGTAKVDYAPVSVDLGIVWYLF